MGAQLCYVVSHLHAVGGLQQFGPRLRGWEKCGAGLSKTTVGSELRLEPFALCKRAPIL